MRKNLGAKPLCHPQPVFVVAAYGGNNLPCAMVAAWGGITARKEVTLCLDRGHLTVDALRRSGFFTISMATARYEKQCDFLGIVSGRKVPDKVAKAGFHVRKAEFVNAPLIEELPLALECRLISYDEERELVRAEIVNVSADESILSEEGKVSAELLQPLCFDPFDDTYRIVGNVAGKAFKDGEALKEQDIFICG